MKSESGITLIAATIYIIAFLIIVSGISVVTTYFYNNVDIVGEDVQNSEQYTKFNSFFAEEVNLLDNSVVDVGEINDENGKVTYILFASNNQYTYVQANKAIYRNKVKVCSDVTNCTFSSQVDDTNKTKVTVNIEFGTSVKTMTYTLQK